jgi:Uma2 family endonuclease
MHTGFLRHRSPRRRFPPPRARLGGLDRYGGELVSREREAPMIQPEPHRNSIEEFLPILRASDVKLELIDGAIMGFAGGTAAHSILSTRIVSILGSVAKKGCQVFNSDMAIQRADAPTYMFPDASYTCEAFDPDTTRIIAPILVVEVISPESAVRDRIEKLDTYQAMPTVQEYLLVDSRRIWACVYRRFDRMWTETIYSLEDTIELFSLPVQITMADLYAGTGKIIAP